MKIFEAKRRITRHRILSVAIMAIFGILFILAALKSVYFSMAGDASAFSAISQAAQRLIQLIYEKTQFLSLFWRWAPVVNPQMLNTPGNYGLLFIGLCAGIGRIMWDSASNLSARVAKTIRKVEELEWEQELRGQKGISSGSKPDVLQINIDLEQRDQWYKRPVGLVLLGVAIAALGQWVNLQFGLVK